jgi:hypothetical protein
MQAYSISCLSGPSSDCRTPTRPEQGGQTTVLRKVKKKEKTSPLKSASASCNQIWHLWHAGYIWNMWCAVTSTCAMCDICENMRDNIALKHASWFVWCILPWWFTSWYLISYNQSHGCHIVDQWKPIILVKGALNPPGELLTSQN